MTSEKSDIVSEECSSGRKVKKGEIERFYRRNVYISKKLLSNFFAEESP